MDIDFLDFYLSTGKDINKLIRYAKLGRVKSITVDAKKMPYPVSKRNKVILNNLQKTGIIIIWK